SLIISRQCVSDHADLHSFPTRRSSDLKSIKNTYANFNNTQFIYRDGHCRNCRMLSTLSLAKEKCVRLGFAACRLKPRTVRLVARSEEHTSELQSRENLVCRLLLEKKKE